MDLQYDIKFFVSNVLHEDPEIEVSRILVNPPYGIRSARIKALPKIYLSLATFAYKAYAEYLDVFTARPDVLINVLKNYWSIEDKLRSMLGDLLVTLILSERKE